MREEGRTESSKAVDISIGGIHSCPLSTIKVNLRLLRAALCVVTGKTNSLIRGDNGDPSSHFIKLKKLTIGICLCRCRKMVSRGVIVAAVALVVSVVAPVTAEPGFFKGGCRQKVIHVPHYVTQYQKVSPSFMPVPPTGYSYLSVRSSNYIVL